MPTQGHTPKTTSRADAIDTLYHSPEWNKMAALTPHQFTTIGQQVHKHQTSTPGVYQQRLEGQPALPGFTHRPRWRPVDMLLMVRRMAHFYTTFYGIVNCLQDPLPGEDRRVVVMTGCTLAHMKHSAWSDPDLLVISADSAFAQMVQAAAVSSPSDDLVPTDLLNPCGVVFFEYSQEMPLLMGENDAPIRAVTWDLQHDPEHNAPTIVVETLVDGPIERSTPLDTEADGSRVEPLAECFSYLFTRQRLVRILNDTPATEHEHENRYLIGLVRSLAAIARSPHTVDTTKTVGAAKAHKTPSKNSKSVSGTVRLLSLRQPERAQHEYDAAAGTQSRHMRQHWVRGHWRNQWYPGAGENRTIWIDGFIRGDAELGETPTNRKTVYRATAPRS